MIAKITQISANGHYDHPTHGRLFKQQYVFEDGEEVNANHKSEASPFQVGDAVEYEIKGSNSYGNWGSVRKPDAEGRFSGGGGREDRSVVIERSWAMGQAVSMLGTLPARNHKAIVEYMKDACILAETFLTARDTFPKFHQDDAVAARWGADRADAGDLPFEA